MDNKLKFKDEDKTKLVEFLNFIAKNAKFDLDTKEIIRFYGLLTFMQKELLAKVDSNIMEIKRVIEAEKEE